MARKRRGRPQTFRYEDRRKLSELLRQHGARRARAISEVPVSMPTLLKIAREFGIQLSKGRRPWRAA
jgi:hypothetical protein